jgi:hypothetical protein
MAELLKRHADRNDIPFSSAIIEADALCLLSALLQSGVEWHAQTFYYIGYGRTTPFFVRLAQKKNFENLSKISGLSVAELRAKVPTIKEDLKSRRVGRFDASISGVLNLDKWDTLK